VKSGVSARGILHAAMKQRARIESFLTVAEVSDLLRVTAGTLYNWSHRGTIPVQKVGGRLLFSPSALRRWLRDRERRGSAELA
jgi:excisionase family DNA binding protein